MPQTMSENCQRNCAPWEHYCNLGPTPPRLAGLGASNKLVRERAGEHQPYWQVDLPLGEGRFYRDGAFSVRLCLLKGSTSFLVRKLPRNEA